MVNTMGSAGSNPGIHPGITSRCRRGAAVTAAVVIAVGAIVCVGWLLDIVALQRLHPALASMKFNTALVLLLLGAALLRSTRRETGHVHRAFAAIATAIAAASLVEYGLGINLGIDELVCRDPHSIRFPGRMSPATGGCILLLGLALLWLESWWVECVALLGGLAALLPVLGYLYGVRDLYAIGPYS